jgi:hypothetical protein
MPCGFSTRAVQARDVMDILCINLREVSASFGSHAPLPIRGVNLRAGYEGHAALRIRAAAVAGTITRVRVMPGRDAGACDCAALAALIRAERRGTARLHRYFHAEVDAVVAIRTSAAIDCFFAALVALREVRTL